MSNETKYYVPSIEEFHIGFEYELKRSDKWINQEYEPYDDCTTGDVMSWIENKKCRVKYLDKEDIENLGWSDKKHPYQYKFGELKQFELGYYDSAKSIIYIEKDGNEIFVGIIKNKSELKKLMQQLNIQ